MWIWDLSLSPTNNQPAQLAPVFYSQYRFYQSEIWIHQQIWDVNLLFHSLGTPDTSRLDFRPAQRRSKLWGRW